MAQQTIMVTMQWVVNQDELPPEAESWSETELLCYLREVFAPTVTVETFAHMPHEELKNKDRRKI